MITKTMQYKAVSRLMMKMTLKTKFAELCYQDFQIFYMD